MREFLPVPRATFVKPLCMSHIFGTDRMRPRITKAKLRGSFLGREFVGCFNDRAHWITQLAGIFPVGMVNAPESAARIWSHVRAHARSSPQPTLAKMYLIHKMRSQSV